MRVIIWVSYHDEESEKIARNIFSKYIWAKFIELPNENNPLFESYPLYNKLLDCHAEYIGYLSYKSYQKISIELVDKYTKDIKDYDFVALNCGGSDVLCNKCHPNFNTIWKDIVTPLCPISGHDIWSNLWIMKRKCLSDYCNWFKNIYHKLLEHPLIFSNANWHGLELSKLIKLTGYPYYNHIPFICERLPHTFCINNGYSTYCLFNGFSSFWNHHSQ